MPSSLFFISYTRSDAKFALRLAKDIKDAGINLWIDQLDIPAGNRWDTEVQNALNKADGIIVILTPEAIASNNVQDEISYAIDEGKRILPVYAAECEVPFRIRRLQHIDFINDYEEGLANLLKGLSAEKNEEKTTPENDKKVDTETGVKTGAGKFSNIKKSSILFGLLGAILAVSGMIFLPRIFRNNSNNNVQAKNDSIIKKDTPGLSILSSIDTSGNKTDTAGIKNTKPGNVIPPPKKEMSGTDFYNQGMIFFNNKNYNEAIKNFNAAIKKNYQETAVYKQRGMCYENLNMLKEAIADYTTALTKTPNDADLLVSRGNCYLKLNKKDIACNDYASANLKGSKVAGDLIEKNCKKAEVITAADIVRNITVKVSKATINKSVGTIKMVLHNYSYSLAGADKYLNNTKEVRYVRIDPSAEEYKKNTYISSTQRGTNFQIQQIQMADIKSVYVTIVASDGSISDKQLKGVVFQNLVKPPATILQKQNVLKVPPAALHKQR